MSRHARLAHHLLDGRMLKLGWMNKKRVLGTKYNTSTLFRLTLTRQDCYKSHTLRQATECRVSLVLNLDQ